MTDPKPGDTAICSQCGKSITYIGPAWDHPGEIKPKHPALPAVAGGSHEIALAAADLAEMNRLRLLNADLHLQLTQARERERVVNETYDQQQSSYRELETLYQASQERALNAEADAVALQQLIARYLDDVTISPLVLNEGLRDHPGAQLLAELAVLRELADDLIRWREADGDIRDLTYVFETMNRYQAMKEGAK